jgi:hypothetical protein
VTRRRPGTLPETLRLGIHVHFAIARFRGFSEISESQARRHTQRSSRESSANTAVISTWRPISLEGGQVARDEPRADTRAGQVPLEAKLRDRRYAVEQGADGIGAAP